MGTALNIPVDLNGSGELPRLHTGGHGQGFSHKITHTLKVSARTLVRAAEVAVDVVRCHCATPYSRLYIVSDGSDWVLNEEARELRELTHQLGITSRRLQSGSTRGISGQVLFHNSQWALRDFENQCFDKRNRIAFSYFHGMPAPDQPEFNECFALFKKFQTSISKVQVSHRAMQTLLLETGIAPDKVALIPIGINLNYFPRRDSQRRLEARRALSIPESAFIVGSFQKDGTGWGEGEEPKLIKGPDVLLSVLERLKSRVPELFVLLSGPSRGFVKRGLTQKKIPFQHLYLKYYPEVARLYEACDAILVTSREEGGPKAVLESMATGVPLVTTAVGQASELVRSGVNGYMTQVGDVEGLTHYAEQVARSSPTTLAPILSAGRKTAEDNSYPQQINLWRDFFYGLIETPHSMSIGRR